MTDIPKHYEDACEPNHVSWLGKAEYSAAKVSQFGGGVLYSWVPEEYRYVTRVKYDGLEVVYTDDPRTAFAHHFKDTPDPEVRIDIGQGCNIHPTVDIGDTGFGYASGIPMPHWGNVIIGSRVHIRAFTTVHRGALRDTVIRTGAKIDAHCHVAHNAVVGKDAIICAGAVLCGSVEIGNRAYLGVNCCIKQRVKVGADAVIGMGAVVTKDVPPGEVWVGNPARRLR